MQTIPEATVKTDRMARLYLADIIDDDTEHRWKLAPIVGGYAVHCNKRTAVGPGPVVHYIFVDAEKGQHYYA